MANFELIEKYLDGNLSEKKVKEFNVRLEVDTNFRIEYELRKEVNASILDEASELRGKLDNIQKNRSSRFRKFLNKYFSFK